MQVSASLNPIPIGVARGDVLTAAQWRTYTEAVAALVGPSPDDNNGSRILGRSLGLPVPFSPYDPNFRTVGLGPGHVLTVPDGMWLYVLYMGTSGLLASQMTITYYTGTSIATATLTAGVNDRSGRQVVILGAGQTIKGYGTSTFANRSNGGGIGVFQSIPFDLEVIGNVATTTAPFQVPAGKVAYITAILSAGSANTPAVQIDGAWGPWMVTMQQQVANSEPSTMHPIVLRAGQSLAPTGENSVTSVYVSGVLATAV